MRLKRNFLSRGSRARDFTIKVTSCLNSSLQGELQHVLSGQVNYFRSFLEMVFLIDERLEELGLPQPNLEMRSWRHPYLVKKEEVNLIDNSAENENFKNIGGSEFLVRVLFRQNASWQGEVHWLDSDEKKNFRSLLELIVLLQEAMDKTSKPKADYIFKSWSSENEPAQRNTR